MNMKQIAGLFEDFIPSYECHASPGAQGSITLQFDSRVTSDAHFTIQGITPERAGERAAHPGNQPDPAGRIRPGTRRPAPQTPRLMPGAARKAATAASTACQALCAPAPSSLPRTPRRPRAARAGASSAVRNIAQGQGRPGGKIVGSRAGLEGHKITAPVLARGIRP